MLTSDIDLSCMAENDTVWGIQWRQTNAGTMVIQKCPGLSESAGKKKLLYCRATYFQGYKILSVLLFLENPENIYPQNCKIV